MLTILIPMLTMQKLLNYCMKIALYANYTKDRYNTITKQPMILWQMNIGKILPKFQLTKDKNMEQY